MTWTYNNTPGDDDYPGDEVRLLVGDTNEEDPLVQDEEITYFLSLYPKVTGKPAYLAAAAAAEAIAAKFARKMNTQIGPLSAQSKQQRDHYVELAAQLRQSWATDGKGGSTGFASVRASKPRLSGGGRTVLGTSTLSAGGGGY